MAKIRVLIFIVSYNAESTIQNVIDRIPATILNDQHYEFEILIIDDCSIDSTFETIIEFSKAPKKFPIRILKNPNNLGYGGNQKLGYRYAIDNKFDIVALVHGDGQYAPEELPNLLKPLFENDADAVFGSRMIIRGAALKGGMPIYKYYGNKLLSYLQNRLVGTSLSEYHSGYRLYSCSALKKIPFERNSNGFEFDTEIIIQCHRAGLKIIEMPIPTFYGNEICHVKAIPYAYKVLTTSLNSHLQDLGLFFDPKFEFLSEAPPYQSKFSFTSSHSFAFDSVSPGDRLLILGCGPANSVQPFVEKGCIVSLVDRKITNEHRLLARNAYEVDLNNCNFELFFKEQFDYVLLLDVIEHLQNPEFFLYRLREYIDSQKTKILISTPNVGFIVTRLSLLFGQFNYGPRGILDFTHTRLFTFGSLLRIIKQQGYSVISIRGVPAPYPLSLGFKSKFAKILLKWNSIAIYFLRNLFSYQTFIIASVNPTVSHLLVKTIGHTNEVLRDANK